MKKAFLLLSFSGTLLACSSNPEQNTAQTATAAPSETTTAAEQPEDGLDKDSTTGANVTAVAHQPQVDTSVTKIGTAPTGNPVGGEGAKLIAASGCAGCHREREKLIGPAYVAVAQKYPNTSDNVNMLSHKIIGGGSGNWGDIAMTPHPSLSEADATTMTRYILSLR